MQLVCAECLHFSTFHLVHYLSITVRYPFVVRMYALLWTLLTSSVYICGMMDSHT